MAELWIKECLLAGSQNLQGMGEEVSFDGILTSKDRLGTKNLYSSSLIR